MLGRFFFQNEDAVRFEQLWQHFVRQKFFGEALARFCFLVGWIGEDDSELLRRRRALQKFECILLANASLELRLRQVFLARRNQLSLSPHEKSGGGAAAKRLNPERATPGEKIENARADDFSCETREDGGLNAIHCRSHAAFRNSQLDSA